MFRHRFQLSAFFIVAFFCASAISKAVPAFVSYNDLLNAHNIFHDNIDSVDVASSEENHDTILTNLQGMLDNPDVLGPLYKKYLVTFEKRVVGEKSMEIFQKKLLEIAAHNLEARSGKHLWEMGVNQFTDLTREQFRKFHRGYNSKKLLAAFRNSTIPEVAPVRSPAAPDSVDWASEGKVSSVKNQGDCNSCVMYSTSSMLDSAVAIKYGGTPPELSPQELLDCAQPDKDVCNDMSQDAPAMDYMQSHGVSTVADYPLSDDRKQHQCRTGNLNRAASIASWSMLDNGEEELKNALVQGPCAAGIISVSDYGTGIYTGDACTDDETPNHLILVVGYGTENGVDYWLIKNSYGEKWGDHGYFRLQRNNNSVCYIGKDVAYSATAA